MGGEEEGRISLCGFFMVPGGKKTTYVAGGQCLVEKKAKEKSQWIRKEKKKKNTM